MPSRDLCGRDRQVVVTRSALGHLEHPLLLIIRTDAVLLSTADAEQLVADLTDAIHLVRGRNRPWPSS